MLTLEQLKQKAKDLGINISHCGDNKPCIENEIIKFETPKKIRKQRRR